MCNIVCRFAVLNMKNISISSNYIHKEYFIIYIKTANLVQLIMVGIGINSIQVYGNVYNGASCGYLCLLLTITTTYFDTVIACSNNIIDLFYFVFQFWWFILIVFVQPLPINLVLTLAFPNFVLNLFHVFVHIVVAFPFG